MNRKKRKELRGALLVSIVIPMAMLFIGFGIGSTHGARIHRPIIPWLIAAGLIAAAVWVVAFILFKGYCAKKDEEEDELIRQSNTPEEAKRLINERIDAEKEEESRAYEEYRRIQRENYNRQHFISADKTEEPSDSYKALMDAVNKAAGRK